MLSSPGTAYVKNQLVLGPGLNAFNFVSDAGVVTCFGGQIKEAFCFCGHDRARAEPDKGYHSVGQAEESASRLEGDYVTFFSWNELPLITKMKPC